MSMPTCDDCGAEFETSTGVATHIGMKHPERRESECAECGSTFRPPRSNLDADFCSNECWADSRWVTLTCGTCGDDFEARQSKSHREYCSRTCAAESRRNRTETECEWCGATLIETPAVPRRFCDQNCHGAWQSVNRTGEAHPCWEGGHDPYVDGWYEARKDALKRANYECDECGLADDEHRDRHGFGLDVHHKVRPRNYDGNDPHEQSNLVVLCRRDHVAAERRRDND